MAINGQCHERRRRHMISEGGEDRDRRSGGPRNKQRGPSSPSGTPPHLRPIAREPRQNLEDAHALGCRPVGVPLVARAARVLRLRVGAAACRARRRRVRKRATAVRDDHAGRSFSRVRASRVRRGVRRRAPPGRRFGSIHDSTRRIHHQTSAPPVTLVVVVDWWRKRAHVWNLGLARPTRGEDRPGASQRRHHAPRPARALLPGVRSRSRRQPIRRLTWAVCGVGVAEARRAAGEAQAVCAELARGRVAAVLIRAPLARGVVWGLGEGGGTRRARERADAAR